MNIHIFFQQVHCSFNDRFPYRGHFMQGTGCKPQYFLKRIDLSVEMQRNAGAIPVLLEIGPNGRDWDFTHHFTCLTHQECRVGCSYSLSCQGRHNRRNGRFTEQPSDFSYENNTVSAPPGKSEEENKGFNDTEANRLASELTQYIARFVT